MTLEEYIEAVSDDYAWENMEGDPDHKLAMDWINSPEMRVKVKKLFDDGIDWKDVQNRLGWDGFKEFKSNNTSR